MYMYIPITACSATVQDYEVCLLFKFAKLVYCSRLVSIFTVIRLHCVYLLAHKRLNFKPTVGEMTTTSMQKSSCSKLSVI